jgi:deoxycytidylate deaminase
LIGLPTCSSTPKSPTQIAEEPNLEFCRAVHAEESAIIKVANLGGVSLNNATLYVTTFPCQLCAKKIVSAGIRRVVWVEAYPHGRSHEMLTAAGVELVQFSGVKARGFYRLFARPLKPIDR